MRKVVVLAVVAAALAGVPAATAGPAPPTISEPFTLLPCPAKPATTLALEGCAEHRIVASDKQIDAKAKAIFGKLASAASKSRFVKGELAWLAARRAVCLSRSDVYEGGTLSTVTFANCEADQNLLHLKDLSRFLHDLGPH